MHKKRTIEKHVQQYKPQRVFEPFSRKKVKK